VQQNDGENRNTKGGLFFARESQITVNGNKLGIQTAKNHFPRFNEKAMVLVMPITSQTRGAA
jgi:hypothetical protein